MALVQVLIQYANLTPAAAWGIVAGVTFAIGLILTIVMWAAFKRVRVIPYKTLHSIEESLQWITQR